MTRILFIEDEEHNMQSFVWKLQDGDHQVTIAKDAEEAITYLQSGHHDFGLIILDIMLPRGEHKGSSSISKNIRSVEMGLELLRQLREEMKDATPVIVITAITEQDIKIKILSYGVQAYFTKPAPLLDFMKAVDKAIGFASPLP
jgi:CheY-like chemotaxis protein